MTAFILLGRNISLMQEGIKLVYVFDGKMPELKFKTVENRKEAKDIAREKYEKAKEQEDIELMKRYSQQLTKLTPEIKQESIELLTALGIPCIIAPSEAEAQASFLVKKGKGFAIASQDYDSLLFKAPKIIQNLTLARKRKTPSGFISINPELIELEKVLNFLDISHEQLICLGILVGTDYNVGGIKGIGQKKALDIVKKYKTPVDIFNSVNEQMKKQQEEGSGFEWKEIFQLFSKPDVRDFEIVFPKLNEEKVKKILLEKEFSEERINNQLEKLNEIKKENNQKKLF